MINRVMRVFRLDPTVFREVAEDESSLSQAAIIVVIVTLLSGIGAALGRVFADQPGVLGAFLYTWLVQGILLGWIGWSVLTYLIGTKLFQGKTDVQEMMRVLGFANAPQILGIFGIIPCLGWIASIIGFILALIAGFIAVREAMEFDTGKAIATVLIGWVIVIAISVVLGIVLGLGGAALGALGG